MFSDLFIIAGNSCNVLRIERGRKYVQFGAFSIYKVLAANMNIVTESNLTKSMQSILWYLTRNLFKERETAMHARDEDTKNLFCYYANLVIHSVVIFRRSIKTSDNI